VNILTDTLPDTVAIDHTEYRIETDFRTCLRVIMAFEDNELTPQEKQIILLSSVFVDLPTDIEQAITQAMWFLNGGATSEQDAAPMRLYSFAKDAQFIYAAFKQTHGVDLQKDNLHWWQFLALFMDLGSDTTFCQLTALRKRLKTGKATKEEKQAAREMPELVDVPEIDDRTLEEKEAEADFLAKVKAAEEKRRNANV
jgi:hypothetical protein